MSKRSDVDLIASNEELARRLFQREKPGPAAVPDRVPGPLASHQNPPPLGPQTWNLGRPSGPALTPVSERERHALFAALSKGTKANLGREPTVAELAWLVEEVDRARNLVAITNDALDGHLNLYFLEDKLAYHGSRQGPAQRRDGAGRGVA